MEGVQVLQVKNSDKLVAICGCTHGELELIYTQITNWEAKHGHKVSFLICCGDFESVRDQFDLDCMSVPDKYKKLKDFHKYYDGTKIAPVLTIFVGGNHEAMNYLKDLYYGGWVAENIYFMGYSNVININGIRIAGVSGIHNRSDWCKGYYEVYPFQYGELKSSFHTRQYEIMKLALIKDPVDIFVSHDWPTVVGDQSDFKLLTRIKPHFKKDLYSSSLGSPNLTSLCEMIQPRYWFSAHLHIHWEVDIKHFDSHGETGAITKFLSLDKPIVGRGFLDIMAIIPRKKLVFCEDTKKRLYSSMRRFCPRSFEVVEDKEESDLEMDSDSEESKESTTGNEDGLGITKETDDQPAETLDFTSPAEEEQKETPEVAETPKIETPFQVREDQISLDLEWLAIVKATHSMMPMGKHKFNFDEYVHPMQEGHHKLLLKKEEIFKELKEQNLDLKVNKTEQKQIYEFWSRETCMNHQSSKYIKMLDIDDTFFKDQIAYHKESMKSFEKFKQGSKEEPKDYTKKDTNEISLDF